jgi:hypothetical protein
MYFLLILGIMGNGKLFVGKRTYMMNKYLRFATNECVCVYDSTDDGVMPIHNEHNGEWKKTPVASANVQCAIRWCRRLADVVQLTLVVSVWLDQRRILKLESFVG